MKVDDEKFQVLSPITAKEILLIADLVRLAFDNPPTGKKFVSPSLLKMLTPTCDIIIINVTSDKLGKLHL